MKAKIFILQVFLNSIHPCAAKEVNVIANKHTCHAGFAICLTSVASHRSTTTI